MAPRDVIVFGPTGQVGSAAAISAHQRGAKVFLAMRDLQKSIPGLSPEQEQAGGFERVQADLNKPDSIQAAVSKTGATYAFIYVVPGSTDHMKSSIAALKSAGIEFVVFLSSSTVRGDIRSITPENFIAWSHAQVEINLEATFGADGFVAVRPSYFASNSRQWAQMVPDGEVKIIYPDVKFDWISPIDIGNVCGALLAGGLQAERNYVRLDGPELVTQRDAVGIVGRVIGKDIKVTQLDEEEGLKIWIGNGMPSVVANLLVKNFRKRVGEQDGFYKGSDHEEAVGNIEKYTGKRPARYEDWVLENKQTFGV